MWLPRGILIRTSPNSEPLTLKMQQPLSGSLVPIRSTGLSARALALRCAQRPLRSADTEYGANADGFNGFGRHADGAIVKRSERSLSARAETGDTSDCPRAKRQNGWERD